MSLLGWRGLAMLGIAPVVIGALVWFCVPESVRWLTAKGRFAEAREGVARYLGRPLADVPLPIQPPAAVPRGRLGELCERGAAIPFSPSRRIPFMSLAGRSDRVCWQRWIVSMRSSFAIFTKGR